MRKTFFLLSLLFLTWSLNAQVVLEGNITTNTTLTASNNYLLRGFVRVDSNVTLTIQPGTRIYGENATQGTLIIKPGGKLIADGTVNAPIVMTSEFTKPGSSRPATYGDWGGLIILGNAPINVPGGRAAIEGPGDSYGGTNPDDNSGILRYVRVEFPGIAFSANNEINGVTFGGVGRGTTVEYVQVSYSGDDSFEWFGGNVNCKYLIAHRGWDDDFDTDFGYSGKLQFLLGVRDPEIADVSGSHGFESDNDGSGSSNQPLTSPEWWNVTLVGPLATNQTVINSNFRRAMHLRRNSQNKINNTLMVGWPVGVLFDGTGTINGVVNGTCYIKNSILAGYRDKSLDTTRSNGTFDPIAWFQSGANNNGRIYTNTSDALLTDAFNLNLPNAMPAANSPALTGGATPPNDGFFDATATYVGAFGSVNWTAGWSNFSPVTSIGDDNTTEVVTSYELGQNYPNPFNPSTNIRFTLPESANVKLSVFNTLGEKVAELVNSTMDAGLHEVNFNAAGLSSGLYIYRLEAGNVVLSRKMNLLK